MGNRAERHERERERERQRSGLRESERMSIGKKGFKRGSEMAIGEMEHLSIFITVNQ